MTPTSKYFGPKELIQPDLLEHLTVSALMHCIGQYNLTCLDILRSDYEGSVRASDRYKSECDKHIHINGLYNGQLFKHSGLRSLNCPEGAEHSHHKNGNTFDLKCAHIDILLGLILDNYKSYSISRIENPELTVFRGWIHCEFMASVGDLVIFNP